MKRQRVFTWTTLHDGRTVRWVVATHSKAEAARVAGLGPIEASLQIGETLNPVLVAQALERAGTVQVVGTTIKAA